MASLKIFVALFWASSAMAYHCSIRDVTVTCKNVKGKDSMLEMLREVRENKIYRNGRVLQLEDFENLINLPAPSTFKNMGMNRLVLKNGELPFFQSPVSKGEVEKTTEFSTLEVQSVVGIHNWNWKRVSKYADIQRLIVTDSRWRRLPSELSEFYGNRVDHIEISSCHVRWLDDDSLYCPSCQSISLENNDIQQLRKEVFGNGLRKLQDLNLSKNKIQSLPPDLFDNFNNLQQDFRLTLSDNPITVLDEATFKNLPKTITLISDKDSTVLECDPKYDWICNGGVKCETGSFYCLLPDKSRTYSIPKYFENVVGIECS